MHKVKYALFFDNHTQMENPDVGRNFDPDCFTDEIKKCGVDYLVFHARCNVGFAYYNTKIGTRHPALQYDLFGRLAESCKKKNIALVAYLNGGISTFEANQHRDWITRYMPDTSKLGQNTPFAMTMCYNSPFRAHIISMIREIAQNYPVQGFFIDCLGTFPCVCPTCVKMMKEAGLDWRKPEEVEEFARQSVLRFCKDIAISVRKIIPDPMLYFNGPTFGDAKNLDTFYDCECLPTSVWGYEFLPTLAHSLRNIKPDFQILNMTARFYSWGDFGGLRPAESIKFDLFYGLAHGMRPNVGGHFHPRGDKDQAVFKRIREVYKALQKYDTWYENARNLADIAIVYPNDTHHFREMTSIRSAVRMLEELKMQFDILFADCEKPWNQYKLLILPENVEVTKQLSNRVKEYISGGGAFFSCGRNAAESFGDELGIEYLGDSSFDPVYFQLNGEFSQGMEDMFLSLYLPASKVALRGAEGASRLVKPYYNAGWNGEFPIYYTPPQKAIDLPFITTKEKCIWCAGDLFGGYAKRGAIHLRDLFRNIIGSLVKKPLVKTGKLPACVRLVVTEQPNRYNIHVIAYLPEKRANCNVVEDAIAVIDGSFKVLTAGHKVIGVTLAPDEGKVDYTVDGDYTEIKLPPFEGYALVSIQFA